MLFACLRLRVWLVVSGLLVASDLGWSRVSGVFQVGFGVIGFWVVSECFVYFGFGYCGCCSLCCFGFCSGDLVFVFTWFGGLPGSAYVGFCGGFGPDL